MEKVAMHAINLHMFVFQLFDVASQERLSSKWL